ncbi:hypothetical protein BKA70DRAFT_1096499 [Coprinopsis sp. MPI-PUGE-AT-0042]|nr:hypothetical protein BKA70DRAFT_1096499 [Coprinopsis sp. MPI-PUGE-AT-0042]
MSFSLWFPASDKTGRKSRLSLQLRCLPTETLWPRMQAMKKDATLGEIAEEIAGIPQSWPSRGEMPFVTLHPGEPKEKVWLPNEMPSNDPNDRSRTVQLENHLVVGNNKLRIIQLSPLPAFTFVLYACERPNSGLDDYLGRARDGIPLAR